MINSITIATEGGGPDILHVDDRASLDIGLQIDQCPTRRKRRKIAIRNVSNIRRRAPGDYGVELGHIIIGSGVVLNDNIGVVLIEGLYQLTKDRLPFWAAPANKGQGDSSSTYSPGCVVVWSPAPGTLQALTAVDTNSRAGIR